MSKSVEDELKDGEDGKEIILNMDGIENQSQLETKSVSKFSYKSRNLHSRQNIDLILTSLPSIDRKTFKSMVAEDQK